MGVRRKAITAPVSDETHRSRRHCFYRDTLPSGIPPNSEYLLKSTSRRGRSLASRTRRGYTTMGVRNWAAILGISAILSTSADAAEPGAGGPNLLEEDGDRGEVPLRGRGGRRREQGRQARRPHRRLLVRGPGLDQARHPQARRLRRRPAQLQRVHDLLGRRRQRRRLARPDRHRLPRQAPRSGTRTPRASTGHWPAHEIWPSACNETPLYTDLFGDGRRVLVMGWQPKGKQNEGQMAWFTPGDDPTQPWEMHPISEPSTPARPSPAPSSSRTGSASATSTATAART